MRPIIRFSPRIFLAWVLAAFFAALPAQASDAPRGAQHRATQLESFVSIEPFYTTIFEGLRPRGLLLVEFGLDVPDADLHDTVVKVMPELRDAYVRNLILYGATAVRPWKQPDVADIANRLQAITDQKLGRKGARVLMVQTAIRITR